MSSNPYKSHYTPPPPPPDSGAPDPDSGKDLGYLVPHLGPNWTSVPSYNDPPAGGNGGKAPDDKVIDVGILDVDLGSLHDTQTDMFNRASTLSSSYEDQRNTVMSEKDWIFGQQAKLFVPEQTGKAGVEGGHNTSEWDQAEFAEKAKEFADRMNPTQEKGLLQVAGAIETLGQFAALINAAGQSYAQVDRGARFPDPPPSAGH